MATGPCGLGGGGYLHGREQKVDVGPHDRSASATAAAWIPVAALAIPAPDWSSITDRFKLVVCWGAFIVEEKREGGSRTPSTLAESTLVPPWVFQMHGCETQKNVS